MGGGDSRIDRALRILRPDRQATAESLAEVLWLASRMAPPMESELPPVTTTSPPPPPDVQSPPNEPPPIPPATSGNRDTPPPDGKTRLYAPQRVSPDEAFIPATFITVRSAESLPSRLAIERALKPFLKRFPSRRLKQLDGDKTAQASADRRAITPMFEPLPERWFDVLLLVERSDAMEVWAETVRELQMLLGRHGAFRKVRTLRFAVAGDAVVLFTVSGQPLSARGAADPEGRRLCLFLTNGTSLEWRRQPLTSFAQSLGKRTVVAILQMLPRRLWAHTALGDAMKRLHSLVPGAPNAALLMEDPLTAHPRRTRDAACVPALTLEPASVRGWARFVMSTRRIVSPAILLSARTPSARTKNRAVERKPSERLGAFRATSSEEAFQLLRMLAGAPLTLPIMRLIQQAVSPSPEQFHLAEAMLSGLIERVTPKDAAVPADQVFYDFLPGVRELLLGTLSSQEADTLDEAMQPAQERLRAFVEAKTGRPVPNFRALLADPAGVEKLPASARSFVEVSRRIYEARGILPPDRVEIGPMVLSDEPVARAVVSGRGRYVIASVKLTLSEWWFEILERGPGGFYNFGGVPAETEPWLLAAADNDRIFGATPIGLIPLTGAGEPLPMPVQANVCAVNSDGTRVAIGQPGRLGCWLLDDLVITRYLNTGRQDTPTAIAMGIDTVFAGYADGNVIAWNVDSGKSQMLPSDWPVAALAISRDGTTGLMLSRSHAMLLLTNLHEEFRGRPLLLYATCVAMSANGAVAAIGCFDGSVGVWDLSTIGSRPITNYPRHGKLSVNSVSLSATGEVLVSASDEGVKSWDVRTLLPARQRPSEPPKAATPRRVQLIGDEPLLQQVALALRAAGHTVVAEQVEGGVEYTVFATTNSVTNPYFPDALYIRSMADVPSLLSELDRDPPGVLHNMPPEIQNPIERPAVEAQLADFILDNRARLEAAVAGDDLSGTHVSLARVVKSDRIRRAFPSGIYWDVEPYAFSKAKLGATLTLAIRNEFQPRPQNFILRLVRSSEEQRSTFSFPSLSRGEAENHLRSAGVPTDQIAEWLPFHWGIPQLVSFAAGAFRHKVKVEWYSPELPQAAFERAAGIALGSLDQTALVSFIYFSAHFDSEAAISLGPFSNYKVQLVKNVPFWATGLIPDATIGFARDFGWLLMSGTVPSLLGRVREIISRLYPKEYAEAHEGICSALEISANSQKGLVFSLALEHAVLAGGTARLERYLRHPFLLYRYLQWEREQLRARLEPFLEKNQFLRTIYEAAKDDSWTFAPVERVYSLLAPPLQWPPRSGVPDAFAQQIRGTGIRISVPGAGCDPTHPEFAERAELESSSDSSGYGTSVCSVAAGSFIGVAPGAVLEPLPLSGEGLQSDLKTLAAALASLVERTPDILCFTLGVHRTASESQPLRDAIQELLKRDVLVIASAGNEASGTSWATTLSPQVLSVGACDFDDRPANFSTAGEIYGYGVNVMAANLRAGGYAPQSGTSFACAYVCGIAALYAQAMGIRGESLRQILLRTADPTSRVARFALETVPPTKSIVA
jgi:hypothetical protein